MTWQAGKSKNPATLDVASIAFGRAARVKNAEKTVAANVAAPQNSGLNWTYYL
jgi:hypothetical protein